MLYKFLLTFFMICHIITLSWGSCPDDFKYLNPSECSDHDVMVATPSNHICSISYLLFSHDESDSPCYVEPDNQTLDCCQFNPSKKTHFLIHGYSVKLKPGNVLERIKDEILTVENANVIIVNWTNYNTYPFNRAVSYIYPVGVKVGNFINFLVREKQVDPSNVHIIGHSLGAHVAGVAGKQVPGLGRITGLDPTAILFRMAARSERLASSDADFVDVIHCSSGEDRNHSINQGKPVGNIDFYPNGGMHQPLCKTGGNYTDTDGDTRTINTAKKLEQCLHDSCEFYFLHSIRDCKFSSTECSSYENYNEGKCDPRLEKLMGFYAAKIPILHPYSTFFLNTTANAPYCSENHRQH